MKNLNYENNRIHDVQLLKDGNFLIYHNNFYKKLDKKFTEIIKVDPINFEVVKNFDIKNRGHKFYKDRTGGVQILDDGRIIYSVFGPKLGNELVVEDSKGHILLQFAPSLNPLTHFGDNFQDGKIINLSDYMINYHSSF